MIRILMGALLFTSVILGSEITLRGDIDKAVRFDTQTLRAMAPTVIDKLPVVCKSGEEKVAPSRYKGVLLSSLLDQTSFSAQSFKMYNTMAVIVTARDGYRVMFSYNELYNTAVGQQVIVAYEKDGRDLENGALMLLSGGDTMTGPRHVRDVAEVEVRFLK